MPSWICFIQIESFFCLCWKVSTVSILIMEVFECSVTCEAEWWGFDRQPHATVGVFLHYNFISIYGLSSPLQFSSTAIRNPENLYWNPIWQSNDCKTEISVLGKFIFIILRGFVFIIQTQDAMNDLHECVSWDGEPAGHYSISFKCFGLKIIQNSRNLKTKLIA